MERTSVSPVTSQEQQQQIIRPYHCYQEKIHFVSLDSLSLKTKEGLASFPISQKMLDRNMRHSHINLQGFPNYGRSCLCTTMDPRYSSLNPVYCLARKERGLQTVGFIQGLPVVFKKDKGNGSIFTIYPTHLL